MLTALLIDKESCHTSLRPFGWRVGRSCKSCECSADTGTGTSSRGLGRGGRRRRDDVSASTGKRAGPGEKRCDVAGGAAAAATGGIEAADSFGPL